jgi:Concanavalin A-like lectin/glucanases superfamily/PKD domain
LKLDESSGTNVADSSSGNHIGTTNGGVAWQPTSGFLTGAASFNGTDSYVSIPDSPVLDSTSAFTLSYWFKANTFNSSGLVSKRLNFNDNNSYSTFLGIDGKLNVDIDSNNNRFTSNSTFERGAWYHIALVFDGSLATDQRAKLYINGELDKTSTETSTSIPNYTAPFLIGILNNPTTAYFDGLIDEVRFHRRALTASEVTAVHIETGRQAPKIAIGQPPPAVINTSVSLTATVAVDSGPAATTAWTKTSGPGSASFSNPSSPVTSVSFNQPGEYVLRLTATNAFGQTFVETNITASLPLPIVTITQPQNPVYLANILHSLRLSASIATQGVPGTPVISWSQASGPGITTFTGPSAADTNATFSSPGNYILRCTVTNTAGSATADVAVSVATPSTVTFRQGNENYSHTATFLRADSTTWNSGSRDLLLVGKSLNGPAFRAVFSFPLLNVPNNAVLTNVSLNLRTHDSQAGTGTVSTLELRPLNDIPTEGTGNSSSDAANGAGTGATWNHRTASQTWTNPGGDFGSIVLTSVPGFNATTLNSSKTFPSTSNFIAAAQAAVSSGQPLSLMLYSPTTESGANNNFIRLSADDHATSTNRPQLSVSWATSPAPVIDPGIAPAAVRNEPANLTGTTTGAASSIWSLISGPGSVLFGNPNLPATTATFSQPGIYQLKLTAIHPNAEVSRSLNLEVTANPAIFGDWQSLTWPGSNDPEIIAPNKDPDQDGIDNLLEWALDLDAKTPSTTPAALSENNGLWEFTYTRRKTAPGEAVFLVEWSDSLESGWADSGVSAESPVSSTASSETVKVTLPTSPNGKAFVRLRVTRP